MRHSSPDSFALSAPRFRDATELVTGRLDVTTVAAEGGDARQRTPVAMRSFRQDDRPAGRMTLLAAG